MIRSFAAALVFMIGLSVFAQSLVVFDGADKKKGQSWADPKDTVVLTVSDAQPFNGRSALELKAKWSNWWAGGGWNWFGWYGPGDDLSQYTNLTFQIKKSSGDLKDLFVAFVDTANKASKPVNIIESGCITAIGAEYAKVTVPMSKFTGEFNSKAVWGINFGILPQAQAGECTLYFAQIEFIR